VGGIGEEMRIQWIHANSVGESMSDTCPSGYRTRTHLLTTFFSFFFELRCREKGTRLPASATQHKSLQQQIYYGKSAWKSVMGSRPGSVQRWRILPLFAAGLAATCMVLGTSYNVSGQSPKISLLKGTAISLLKGTPVAQANMAARKGSLAALQALVEMKSGGEHKRSEIIDKIRQEALQAGVRVPAEAREATASAGGHLGDREKTTLIKYIKNQQHLLSKIESLSGIEFNQARNPAHEFPKRRAPHIFPKTEHYHNIFDQKSSSDSNSDFDPDAFSSKAKDLDGSDASARAWHMVSPSSDLAKLDKQKQNKNSDQWNGEENALSALQAKAEARLKKDSLANEDEEKHASTVKPGDIVEVDDSGEEVPSDSVAAVAAAMGYRSVSSFLKAEKKEAAAARVQAVKEEMVSLHVQWCVNR